MISYVNRTASLVLVKIKVRESYYKKKITSFDVIILVVDEKYSNYHLPFCRPTFKQS